MTQYLRYRDPYGSAVNFTVTLGDVVRLGTIQGFAERAEHCQTGTSTLILDDADADLGYSGDAIRGQARLEVDESAMAAGNVRLYTGIFGARTYRRRPDSSLITGVRREIEAELHDLNALLSLRVIPQSDRTAIRPRESVTDRMAWIVASSYLASVADNGLIVANSTMATKADYRGQRAVNVINDCEITAGFGWNAFVYLDEPDDVPSLYFDNSNTSTAYSSTLRITNDLADVDEFTDPAATTFAPSMDAALRRDPVDVGSGVYLPFRNGAVYRTLQTSTDYYGRKDVTAPNSNVSRRDRARDQADDFLFQHSSEEDRITCTVELPPDKVNLLRAGHRVQVKFTHLPGYTSWTWCRVLLRAPGQTQPTDDRYFVDLELSPQEAAAPAGPSLVQYTDNEDELNTSATFPASVTVGNILVALLLSPQGTNSEPGMQGTGWTQLGTYKVAYEAATPFIYAAAWAKVADSTSPVVSRETGGPTKIMFACWELANAAIADVEVLSAERQPDSPMTIGSFSSDGFAVMSCGVTRGNDQTTWSADFTPGTGWAERHDNLMDGNTASYFADATVDGSLSATGTINILGGPGQSVGEWVGFAVRFF